MTDHTPLTTQQLAEIEARVNAATKGPWGFYDGDNYAEVAADMQVTSPGSCNYRERVARLEDEDYWDDQEHDGHDEERAPEQMAANAAFIAAARTDVPALLDYVRRLQAQRTYLLTQLAKRDAESGRGDTALREFLGGEESPIDEQPTTEERTGTWPTFTLQRWDWSASVWETRSTYESERGEGNAYFAVSSERASETGPIRLLKDGVPVLADDPATFYDA
jgi:hypothetical protein